MKSKRQRFKTWARSRPSSVRWMTRTLKPWNRYRIKATGQLCQMYSYSEDGTVTVVAADRIFGWALPLRVFGLKPIDLERAKKD